MSSPPETLHTPPHTLSERLYTVTETLAAARTPQDVCREVLTPALEALGADAGAVFLVDETGERLHLAATRGDEGGPHTLRQDGALNGNSPAVAALGRREPLSSGSRGDLPRAWRRRPPSGCRWSSGRPPWASSSSSSTRRVGPCPRSSASCVP